jgi:hypothetical protein
MENKKTVRYKVFTANSSDGTKIGLYSTRLKAKEAMERYLSKYVLEYSLYGYEEDLCAYIPTHRFGEYLFVDDEWVDIDSF